MDGWRAELKPVASDVPDVGDRALANGAPRATQFIATKGAVGLRIDVPDPVEVDRLAALARAALARLP